MLTQLEMGRLKYAQALFFGLLVSPNVVFAGPVNFCDNFVECSGFYSILLSPILAVILVPLIVVAIVHFLHRSGKSPFSKGAWLLLFGGLCLVIIASAYFGYA